jgi:hypothetical protein
VTNLIKRFTTLDLSVVLPDTPRFLALNLPTNSANQVAEITISFFVEGLLTCLLASDSITEGLGEINSPIDLEKSKSSSALGVQL